MAIFTSKATGNWDTEGQTTWNEAGHPGAGDSVTIQNGHTVTLDSPAACTTLVIDSGGVLTDATNNQGLTVSGYSEISGTLTCGSAAMSFASGQTGAYGVEFMAGSEFNGGSGNHTFGSIGFIGCTATLTTGITDIDSYWDWGGGYTLVFNGEIFDHNGGTIKFSDAANNQTMWCCAHTAHEFNNLIVDKGASTLLFGSACGFTLTVANDLTVSGGTFSTITQNSLDCDLVVTGDTSITGFLDCNGSTVTLNGDVTIEVGGTLTATTATLSFAGATWTNSDTFTHSSGSVVFSGTNQGIIGSNTWFNFDKHVASAATLTTDNLSTQTVEGALNLYGASGQLLSIISDSAGDAFNLTLTGTKGTLQYLSVKDSDASGSDGDVKPLAPTNSVNVSNTTDWFPTSTQPEMQVVIVS